MTRCRGGLLWGLALAGFLGLLLALAHTAPAPHEGTPPRGPAHSARTLAASSPTTVEQPAVSPGTVLAAGLAVGYKGAPDLDPHSIDYGPRGELSSHQWHLEGEWQVNEEAVTALSEGATLRYRFDGRTMAVVLDAPSGARVRVRVDGRIGHPGADVVDGVVTIDSGRAYEVVRLPRAARGTLVELSLDQRVAARAVAFES